MSEKHASISFKLSLSWVSVSDSLSWLMQDVRTCHQCCLDSLKSGGDITNLRKRVSRCQQHIFRFQVTVDDVLEVKVSQSHQDLREGDGLSQKGRKVSTSDSACSSQPSKPHPWLPLHSQRCSLGPREALEHQRRIPEYQNHLCLRWESDT